MVPARTNVILSVGILVQPGACWIPLALAVINRAADSKMKELVRSLALGMKMVATTRGVPSLMLRIALDAAKWLPTNVSTNRAKNMGTRVHAQKPVACGIRILDVQMLDAMFTRRQTSAHRAPVYGKIMSTSVRTDLALISRQILVPSKDVFTTVIVDVPNRTVQIGRDWKLVGQISVLGKTKPVILQQPRRRSCLKCVQRRVRRTPTSAPRVAHLWTIVTNAYLLPRCGRKRFCPMAGPQELGHDHGAASETENGRSSVIILNLAQNMTMANRRLGHGRASI